MECSELEVIRKLEDLKDGTPSVVTVGVFDGVHLGHHAIMEIVRKESAGLNARSVVITFDRNPEEIIHPHKTVPYITTLSQKLALIGEQGIDLAVVLPLEAWLIKMPAEEFVKDILYKKLSAVQVVVGTNFVFGKDRTGSVRLLQEMGKQLGFNVTAVPPVKVGEISVSSTAIRGLLADGKIERANKFLGRPFSLDGKVITGEGIGQKLGFPTANIQPAEKQIVPGEGVYAISLVLNGEKWTGVANIGTKPTVDGKASGVEVHIIGFSGNIYGHQLELMFHHRLRSEVRFSSTEALKQQISRDVERAAQLVE